MVHIEDNFGFYSVLTAPIKGYDYLTKLLVDRGEPPERTLADQAGALLALDPLGSLALLLFLSEAIKCFYNTSFWVKMITLPIALAFTFVVRDPQIMKGAPTQLRGRILGSGSMLLWFVVAAAGRWIGFS